MSSPAERYAAARQRQHHGHDASERFRAGLEVQLDDFQVRAIEAVEDGRGVLVAAPTGAGKTVVGEFAVALALETGRKAFYTTPIKALSNQKYHDLVALHGAANVGLLTGDASINSEAPVVVMTTEVLRNMMYAGSSTLLGLGFVVMDEVHYLADRFRGAVWEEVIIHLPPSVQVISLSATVSNAEEFGDWLRTVRSGSDTEVIVTEHRPVPLWQHLMVGPQIFDLFVGADDSERAEVNPGLLRQISNVDRDSRWRREDAGGPRGRHGKPRGHGPRGQGPRRHEQGGGGGQGRVPSRAEVVERLDRDGLLPAITFIFSRAGCEGAVGQLLGRGVRLVSDEESQAIRRLVQERVAEIADADLGVLGYHDFVEGLTRGFAAHHAGMLPLFREIVEELFTAGRVRAVFATETLALGINMPARTVVLEKLVKFNGEQHAPITPAEYTQLTGRAGRRGIDVEGHAVVLWRPGIEPAEVAGLASTRTYPLRSSFRPSPNMAVNLVAQFGRERAHELLQASFAQFQADRSVVGLSTTLREHEEALAGYAEAMQCDRGDAREYTTIRHRISQVEKAASRRRAGARRAAIAHSLDQLRTGDVVRTGTGRRGTLAVVVAVPQGRGQRQQHGHTSEPSAVTSEGRLRRLALSEFRDPVQAMATIRVPKQFNARNAKSRKDLAATLRAQVPPDQEPSAGPQHGAADGAVDTATQQELDDLRRQLAEHPCHACPEREDHARWAARWWQLRREADDLQRRVSARTTTVASTFERICDLLVELGYLTEGGDGVSPRGQALRRIYTEADLVAAESLRRDTWTRLDAAGLAAVVSALVHEPRGGEENPAPAIPTVEVAEAIHEMEAIWTELGARLAEHRLPPLREPDAGIAWMVHRWASGRSLEEVLRGADLSAGDFVRRVKQVIDLLGQITHAADGHVAGTARRGIEAMLRGVVAADRLD